MQSKYRPLPSQKYLCECFEYDAETGVLLWKVRPKEHFKTVTTFKAQQKYVGAQVGYINKKGYRVCSLNGSVWLVHRLIWKLVTGNDPTDEIDHRNLERDTNSIANLREADHSGNMRNKKVAKDTYSGAKGVSFRKERGLFRARIRDSVTKKAIHLGYFKTVSAASEAYIAAAIERHGAFAKW